jgi:hypothetical protein
MSLLAANRRALATRFPEVLKALESVAPVASPATATAEESSSFIDEVARSTRQLLVLTGLPGPATTSALRERAPRESVCWCLELAPAPLAARLAIEDHSAWLSDPRVFLSVGVPTAHELQRLNRELAWCDRARALPLASRVPGHEQSWKAPLVATLGQIQQRWQNVFTDITLSPVRWDNTCANLPAFLSAPSVEALAGAFAGAPLVLVAAGPSLDDALPFLRRVAPHALVVTGNTSFRALAAHGISPHLTVTIDPFPGTELGYDGQPLGHTHLISPVFAYPGVHRRFTGRLFGMPDESQLLRRLRTAAGLPPAPSLLGEATVSTTVLNLAAYFGCNRVVFVGQDFAVADDGRTHAADTFYTDLGLNRQDNEKVQRLPGTTRPAVTVPTRHVWYLRAVEERIARTPSIRFLNTSHCGAAIVGAPFANYESAAKELITAPPRDFAAEIASIHTRNIPPTVPAESATELGRTRTAMAEAFRLSLAAALTAELAVTTPSRDTRRNFETATRRFEQWCATHPVDRQLLFEGRTKPEIFEAEKRRIRIPLDVREPQLLAATESAWAYAEGAGSVYRGLLPVVLPT